MNTNIKIEEIVKIKQDLEEFDYIQEIRSIYKATMEIAFEELADGCFESYSDDLDEASDYASYHTLAMAEIVADEIFEIDGDFDSLIEASLTIREFGAKGITAAILMKNLWQDLYELYQEFYGFDEEDIKVVS